MKKIKLNNYKIFTILLSGFVLITSTSCSSKHTQDNSTYANNNYVIEQSQTIQDNTENTENVEENEIIETNNIAESSEVVNEPSDLTDNDSQVIEYFDDLGEKVDVVLNSAQSEEVKDKLKGTFITIVDFIFYDGEINGIKFDDLTEGAKQNILETISLIDSKIMIKYPNYKEEISDVTSQAYNKASELIKKGANNIKDFSKEKLGEENYNAIIEAKDELVYYTKNAVDIVGNAISNIWNSGKSKLKSWYENLKNN